MTPSPRPSHTYHLSSHSHSESTLGCLTGNFKQCIQSTSSIPPFSLLGLMTTLPSGGPHQRPRLHSSLSVSQISRQFIHSLYSLFTTLVQVLNYFPLDLAHSNPSPNTFLKQIILVSCLTSLWFFCGVMPKFFNMYIAIQGFSCCSPLQSPISSLFSHLMLRTTLTSSKGPGFLSSPGLHTYYSLCLNYPSLFTATHSF